MACDGHDGQIINVVYVGAFFLAQRACVAYIWLLFKYAFICIPNTGRHIRTDIKVYSSCFDKIENNMEKKYHTVRTITKCNRQIVEIIAKLMPISQICTNLTSNEIFSLAIVGILTADVYTENML